MLCHRLNRTTHLDCETIICLWLDPVANSIYLETQILAEISCVLYIHFLRVQPKMTVPLTQSDLLWSHNKMTTSAGKTKRFDFTPPIRLTGRDPQAPLSATAFRHCCSAEAQGARQSLREHMIPEASIGGLACAGRGRY